MAVRMTEDTLVTALQNKATRLRIESVRSTSEAGSGHPSSCLSAADIVAALFFSVMRYDTKNPKNPNNDRFILSKGHAAPLLYAAWAEAGLFDKKELLRLRTLASDLEGHPTPRLDFVDVATGSLGQGLSAGVGMALNARLDHAPYRTYVLLGDGESVEGSVWEAVEIAQHYALDNLCAIVDVNRFGQSDPTMLQHNMEAYRSRWAG
ncbi:MAG: transketolase, partial [Nitrospiraceae bacterium]